MPSAETREQVKPRAIPYTETKTGRPTLFSPELAYEICDRMAGGELISHICQDDHMPYRQTVWDWRERYPQFNDDYARAERLQAECLADDMIVRSRDESRDYQLVTRKLKDGTVIEERKSDNTAVQRDTLITRSYQWAIERKNERFQLRNNSVNVNVAVAPAFNVLPASAAQIEAPSQEPIVIAQVTDKIEDK